MSYQGNPSLKNQPLSSASADLGLGDQLQTQLMDTLADRKKKKAAQLPNATGALNPNTNGISAAVASLLGNVGGGM